MARFWTMDQDWQMYCGGGGGLNDTHKATENNTAEIIGEGKSMCVCVCVCLGRDKNQGTHKSISYTHSVI